MGEHTRNWSVQPLERHYGGYTISGLSFNTAFFTVATDVSAEQARQKLDDAHLIVAAPDLLDAAQEAEKHFGPFADITINGQHDADDVRVVALLRAAIARATGAA